MRTHWSHAPDLYTESCSKITVAIAEYEIAYIERENLFWVLAEECVGFQIWLARFPKRKAVLCCLGIVLLAGYHREPYMYLPEQTCGT